MFINGTTRITKRFVIMFINGTTRITKMFFNHVYEWHN
jgi:hypothetical protein